MNSKKKLKTFTVLTILSVFTISIINRIICFFATLDNLLDKTDGQHYKWRFGDIFYTKQGKGKPIILIHDLNTMSSGYEWNKILEHLSKNHTVYVIDLLGCGRSSKPNITYTNYLYVQLLMDFIKNVVGEKVDIISSGISSSFVLTTCRNENSIIDKIIMINPYTLTSLNEAPSKNTKIIKMLINTPIIGTLVYNIIFSKKNIASFLHKEYFYSSDRTNENLINMFYETAHTSGSASKYLFSSIKGRYVNANIIHIFEHLNNSIFIITGDKKIDGINNAAKQYVKFVPAIEVFHINKSLLAPHIERPEEFINQIEILLE